MKALTVLGATGSIGVSTLDVAARHPDKFDVVALSGRSNIALLADQCIAHQPRFVAVGSDDAAVELKALRAGKASPDIAVGEQALVDIASLPEIDVVMAAIVGAAGMPSALAAAQAGKTLLLANKEALVLGGRLFMNAVKQGGGSLLPIDSEHNAIYQCLPHGAVSGERQQGVSRLLLTASGGPFRERELSTFTDITVAEAMEQLTQHPAATRRRVYTLDNNLRLHGQVDLVDLVAADEHLVLQRR